MEFLNYTEQDLQATGGYWTAREIEQQPEVWDKTIASLSLASERIDAFMLPVLQRSDLRIIFTGAGTSAFIGESITPALCQLTGRRVEAIATTDIVSNPHEYLQADVPTLLISFGRSGNSPESVAAVELADSLIKQCYQVAITCNEDGQLYQSFKDSDNKLALLMPDATNDVSFAMTSSFTSMLLSALYLFTPADEFNKQANQAIAATASLLDSVVPKLRALAGYNFERVIYLGSGGLKGIAREGALKLLELTDGKVVSAFDSPLGFRHGPKTIVNNRTLVVIFLSNHPGTRQYDLDLLNELEKDGETGGLLVIDAANARTSNSTHTISMADTGSMKDVFLSLPYIVCAQILGFEQALSLGNSPDTPSASGTVNRVVKGVNIYDLVS